jgi:hypothetical protein
MYAVGVTIAPELLAHIEPCDLLHLDMTALGNEVARLMLISRQLGHASVEHTVTDYLAPHPAPTPEAQFARELFTSDPERMAEHWCGSDRNAIALTRAMLKPH